MNENRRLFMRRNLQMAGAGLLLAPSIRALAASCQLTPPQTPGPFYPGEERFATDTDLTRIPGQAQSAKGQIVWLKGTVVDESCRPVPDANIEIWQACASGRYNNPRDPNPAPLDPFFRYWAETYTNSDGNFVFKTVKPGSYPASEDWTRPPHIHFRVSKLGYHELVSQLYFKGDPLNERDMILDRVPAEQRASVVIDFLPFFDSSGSSEPVPLIGEAKITIRSVR